MSHQPRNLARTSLQCGVSLVLILTFCFVNAWAASLAQDGLSGIPLELVKPLEQSIAQGETQSYTLTLSAGQYAHVLVDQRGIDVIVAFYGPKHSPYWPIRSFQKMIHV
jgi:hypothetical protein